MEKIGEGQRRFEKVGESQRKFEKVRKRRLEKGQRRSEKVRESGRGAGDGCGARRADGARERSLGGARLGAMSSAGATRVVAFASPPKKGLQ